jgi:hypothetical protein
MSNTVKLEKNAWKPYFDKVSKLLEGKRMEIEVASLHLGAQIAAKWLPTLGVTYDEASDLLAIMAEGLDHMIHRPREVYVQTEGTDLQTISVTGEDGAIQIIRFREPVALPAP